MSRKSRIILLAMTALVSASICVLSVFQWGRRLADSSPWVGLDISADGHVAAVCQRSGILRYLNDQGTFMGESTQRSNGLFALRPDGNQVAIVLGNSSIEFEGVRSEGRSQAQSVPGRISEFPVYSPDGRRLLVPTDPSGTAQNPSGSRVIYVLSVDKGGVVSSFRSGPLWWSRDAIVFSDDGTRVLVGHSLYDARSWLKVADLTLPTGVHWSGEQPKLACFDGSNGLVFVGSETKLFAFDAKTFSFKGQVASGYSVECLGRSATPGVLIGVTNEMEQIRLTIHDTVVQKRIAVPPSPKDCSMSRDGSTLVVDWEYTPPRLMRLMR